MSFLNRFRKDSVTPSTAPTQAATGASVSFAATSSVTSNASGSGGDGVEGGECTKCVELSQEQARCRSLAAQVEKLELDNHQQQQTTEHLLEELSSRERTIKRNESISKDTLRAKEKQIVQQSTQLLEAQGKISQLQKLLEQQESELLRERQRVATVEGRAQDGHEESASMQQQSQILVQQRDSMIQTLERSLAEWKKQGEDFKRKLGQSQDECIQLRSLSQTQESTITSLRDALESEKRMAQLRSGTATAAGGGGAMPTGSSAAPTEGDRPPLAEGSGPAALPLLTSGAGGGGADAGSSNTANSNTAVVVTTPTTAAEPREVREALALENLLRAKDKQVIRLSNDVVKLRADINSLEHARSQLQSEKDLIEATSASMQSAYDECQTRLEQTNNELSRRTIQVAELRSERALKEEEWTALKQKYDVAAKQVVELQSREDAFRTFRLQHVDCQARLVDKDLALFQSSTALSEARRLLDKAYADMEQLTLQVGQLKGQCAKATDESAIHASKSEARLASLEVQLAERKRCVHELEEQLAKRTEAFNEVTNELTSIRALRDDEREAWRTKTQQSQDAFQQLQASIHRMEDQSAAREKQLLAQIEKLQQDNNALLDAKRKQEAHVLHLSESLKREQQEKLTLLSSSSSMADSSSGGGGNTRVSLMPMTPSSPEDTSSGNGGVPGVLKPNARVSFAGSNATGAGAPLSTSAPSSTATTSLQRVSLELEELRQKYSKLQREYAAREQDIENLVRRVREAEGGGGGDGTGSTASEQRRLVGMLESISVELANQLASHLKLDYMRCGAVSTLTTITNAFHLGSAEGDDLIDALSRIMVMVRVKTPIPKICNRLCVKEQSIRRIVTAFSKSGVAAHEDSTSRRLRLKATTPAAAKFTFCGQERLTFLLCASSRPSSQVSPLSAVKKQVSASSNEEDDDVTAAPVEEEEDDSTNDDAIAANNVGIKRLGDDKYVLALVCSYLPVVLRGNTAFAAHVLSSRSSSKPQGQTLLLSLDPAEGTFSMMECEVTASRTIVVLISGLFKSAFSWQSCSHIKVSLSCRTKRDGSYTAESGKWKWSSTERIPKEESSLLQYTIKSDGVFEGLVAETQGVRLRELSGEEVGMISDLYSGDHTAEQMLSHRSWDLIPPPTPARRSGGGGSGGGGSK